MKYVYLNENVVVDVARVNPYSIFSQSYASQFISAPDNVDFFWSLIDGEWIEPPAPDYKEINKQQATQLLIDTDWTEFPSVTDTTKNPHLVNKSDFVNYRVSVRAIAVNPPITPAEFPIKPVEQWS